MKPNVGTKWKALSCMSLVLLSACGKEYAGQRPSLSASPKQTDSGAVPEAQTYEIVPFVPAKTNEAPAPVAANDNIRQKPEAKAETTVPTVTAPEPEPAPAKAAPAAPQPFTPEVPRNSTPVAPFALLKMPEFQASWGVSAELYERAAAYYQANRQFFKNPYYVTVVDFSKHSSEKRFFIFDLRKSQVIRLLTTHGTNSDPQNLGIASDFSNTENSLQSSLGFFMTLDSYEGLNGYSLRLRGLEPSNSNAEKRGIVIHSAPYVNEELGRAGRSWGCLALDPKVSKSVINHLLGGSLLYIAK